MKSPRQGSRGFMLKTIAGAREAPFPTFIQPCKPTLRPKLPEGAKWLYEIKFDGYRAQLHKRGNKVTIYTSSGLDWSDKFVTLCDAARGLYCSELVLDGETAQSVRERLEPMLRKTSPLAKPLRKKDTVWVEPKLSARVQLLELTEDGQVRAGSFEGIAD
jgi:ATP-dependent DNA ligase